MAENIWGTRLNFLNRVPQASLYVTAIAGEEVILDLQKIRDTLGKMDAVRPSPSVSEADAAINLCITEIRQFLQPNNSLSNAMPATGSDGPGYGPSR